MKRYIKGIVFVAIAVTILVASNACQEVRYENATARVIGSESITYDKVELRTDSGDVYCALVKCDSIDNGTRVSVKLNTMHTDTVLDDEVMDIETL